MKEIYDLTNKVALITGGGSGLGKSNAIALAKFGAIVIVTDINYESANEVVKEIKVINKDTFAYELDVTNKKNIENVVEEILKKYKKIDILLNSAGIIAPHNPHIPLVEMDEEKWRNVILVNLTGTFLTNQIVAKEMIKNKWGRIINMASMSGTIINRDIQGVGVYCTAKSGVITFSKALALELINYNITVNTISPGYMDTKLGALSEQDFKNKMNMVPMKRLGKPEELNGLVVYLSSDNASFITGSNIIIDGGYTCW